MTTTKTVCGKCKGSGEYRFHFYPRVEMCFACKGTGRIEIKPSTARHLSVEEQIARLRSDPERLGCFERELRTAIRSLRAGMITAEEISEMYPDPATNPAVALFPGAVRALRELGVIRG